MKEKIKKYSSEIGIASLISFLISWGTNQSILWALFHAFAGAFYLLYWLIFDDTSFGDVWQYYKNLYQQIRSAVE